VAAMTGRLDLRVPCKNCPFADRDTRIKFACRERAEEIAESAYRNGFPCHLSATDTSDEDEEFGGYVFGEKTQHCAGAIGMFLNDGYSEWPGLDNEEPPGDWSEAQKAAFDSEEAFIEANARDGE
jgi:hypothetical protein